MGTKRRPRRLPDVTEVDLGELASHFDGVGPLTVDSVVEGLKPMVAECERRDEEAKDMARGRIDRDRGRWGV